MRHFLEQRWLRNRPGSIPPSDDDWRKLLRRKTGLFWLVLRVTSLALIGPMVLVMLAGTLIGTWKFPSLEVVVIGAAGCVAIGLILALALFLSPLRKGSVVIKQVLPQ